MLGHTKDIDPKLKSFTKLPPLKLGSVDRGRITVTIKHTIGRTAGFSAKTNRYTNEHPDDADSKIQLTNTDGMFMFALERLEAPCKDRPCVGCRVKEGELIYASIYQLDPEGMPEPTVFRHADVHLSQGEWKMFDTNFWDRFPGEKFKDPQWGRLKKEIDTRDKSEIERKNTKHTKSTQASAKRKSEGDGAASASVHKPFRLIAPAPPPQH